MSIATRVALSLNKRFAMFCRFCGKKVLDDSAFCPYCGKTLGEVSSSDSMDAAPVTFTGDSLLNSSEYYERLAKQTASRSMMSTTKVICYLALFVFCFLALKW